MHTYIHVNILVLYVCIIALLMTCADTVVPEYMHLFRSTTIALFHIDTTDSQGRSLRGGKGGNCPPWDFQFLWFFKLIIPKSNTEIATWYLLRRHCPPAYLGQATALTAVWFPMYVSRIT